MSLEVKIYKGDKAAETYIFVADSEDLTRVPDALVKKMGTMAVVMVLDMDAEKQLVRVNGDVVIAAIDAQGYYLQLPPAKNMRERPEK